MLPKRRAVCRYLEIELISYFSVCRNNNMKGYQRKERKYIVFAEFGRREERNGKVMIFFFTS